MNNSLIYPNSQFCIVDTFEQSEYRHLMLYMLKYANIHETSSSSNQNVMWLIICHYLKILGKFVGLIKLIEKKKKQMENNFNKYKYLVLLVSKMNITSNISFFHY